MRKVVYWFVIAHRRDAEDAKEFKLLNSHEK